MKSINKLLLATMAFLCLSNNLMAFQSPTLPFDLFLVGIDSDINTSGEDQVILLSSRDITKGYRFGISNALSDNSIWTSKHTSIEFANLKYNSEDPILQGSAIKLQIQSNGIEVEIDGKSVTDQFEIELSPTYSGDFITSTEFYFSVYSGIMTKSASRAILLGTTLDAVAYGLTESKANDIVLDKSINNKEVLLPSSIGNISTIIDRKDCDLCEILILILFSENWLNIPNTYGFDLDSIAFDIKDCIQFECSEDLLIDSLDCNTLYASYVPCDSITFYQWSKVTDGLSDPILTGNSLPIPNLELESSGLYQLHISCANGCREISNRILTDCFETDCDFDIDVEVNDCEVSVELTGCPDAEYEWHVQTASGTYIIEDSNSPSITAGENGLYSVKITGCPKCTEAVSPSIEVDCGEDCSCDLSFYEQDCLLYFDTTGCINYSSYIEYSPDTSNTWIYLGDVQSPYDPSEYGKGFYRLVLSSVECTDTLVQLYLDCFNPCDEVAIVPTYNDSCNLVFNWSGCFDPNFSILYADDCSNYTIGGADLITSTILPDGSGSAEYLPLNQQGCYQLVLNCSGECNTYSDKLDVEIGDCCESALTIDTSNCVISVSNIPCSGNFIYNVYADGEIIASGMNSTDFSINIDQNASYQIAIECDGCNYYSNIINANCSNECQVVPYLGIGECTLSAIVDNCDNPQIQWQQFINSSWVDLPGETGSTYEIQEDGTFRYSLIGCGCAIEPLFSLEYTSDCMVECDCDISIGIDSTSCSINSTNPGCELIISIEWYYEEMPGEWENLPQYSGQNSISPNLNGKYKKVIMTKNCGQEEAVTNINCLDECVDLNLELDHVGCTITVSWEGCFESNNWEWTFTPNTGGLFDCGTSGNPEPADYQIISQTNNNIAGYGSMEIKPIVDGCYTFTINCNEDCSQSVSTEFVACCSEDAEIELDETPDQVCDYCFFNEGTDELIDIFVIIDGTEIALSSYVDYFDFPYCDDSGNNTCDPGLPSFVDLVNDINSWFAAFGYEGEAFIGNGNGVCKGYNTPFWIQQSNVIFDFSFLFEENVGNQNHPFLEDNCDVGPESGPVLKVINACPGAEYLWSTGETTYSIHYQSGQNYSVTITCPDGCTKILSYGNNGGLSIQGNTNSQERIKSDVSISDHLPDVKEKIIGTEIQLYPNPAMSKVFIRINDKTHTNLNVALYTSQGRLIANHSLTKLSTNTYELDVTNIKSGVYMIHVKEGEQELSIEKIVIIK